MGDVVLGELLRARGLMRAEPAGPELWVAGPTGEQDLPAVMRAATALRRAGRRVEYALRPQQLAKQFKAATAAGAKHVVIVPGALRDGDGAGEYAVRDLATGEQQTYPSIDAVVRAVARGAEEVAHDRSSNRG
jgi:histidyl-tRNA synthetase